MCAYGIQGRRLYASPLGAFVLAADSTCTGNHSRQQLECRATAAPLLPPAPPAHVLPSVPPDIACMGANHCSKLHLHATPPLLHALPCCNRMPLTANVELHLPAAGSSKQALLCQIALALQLSYKDISGMHPYELVRMQLQCSFLSCAILSSTLCLHSPQCWAA